MSSLQYADYSKSKTRQVRVELRTIPYLHNIRPFSMGIFYGSPHYIEQSLLC